MERVWLLLLYLVVLSFCGVVYAACRSWRKMGPRKRIVSVLLLAPHFLLTVCIVMALRYGQAPPGSHSFNSQFVRAVLIVFILPVPAFVGTLAALIVFRRASLDFASRRISGSGT
jgi:hypothetical protein